MESRENDPSSGDASGLDDLLRQVAKAPGRHAVWPAAPETDEGQAVLGPYRILEPLGRGGMGVVSRAQHMGTGELFAVKTVRVAQQSLLQSIRREIHALARIRHPGVVRIVDEGVQDGLPWYAMELLGGATLRRHCTQDRLDSPATPWWTEVLSATEILGTTLTQLVTRTQVQEPRGADRSRGSEPRRPAEPAAGQGPSSSLRLREKLTLVRRLCAPLSYLHGEGIVHRDLKPDNVLVLPNGWPVIVDFGLAARSGAEASREALVVEGRSAGTVAYMAPEQIRGELLDARADLYALGCILYELLTGSPPFVGPAAPHVLAQHLEARPVAPSQRVEGVPPQLDALVLRLLAKRPQARLGYADDVAAALEQLGAEAGLDAAAPRSRAYLYRPGFAGREETLEELEGHFARLEAGSGGFVLIGGESGVGKTRLAMEVARRAAQRMIPVLAGECLDTGARPLEGLRKPLQTVADRCRERGREETERLLGRRGKLLALYEPALAGLPGQIKTQDIASLPADGARLRLFSYLADTFTALTREPGKTQRAAPLVLILDDLQWADDLVLGFLEFTRRVVQLGRSPLLVVGTYRTGEVGATRASPLQRLIDGAGVASIRLGHLDERAVGTLVGDMLALDPPPALFVRYLARHSEGNPFFVAEYLRTAVAEGLLYRDEHGRWQVARQDEANATEATYQTLPLPGSLRKLVRQHLDSLSPKALQVVEVAAVLGREVVEALLADVTRMAGAQMMEAVEELLARQVLEESGAKGLRFLHDKLREVAYEGVTGVLRRQLHGAAAQGLEALYADERDEHMAALGHHWEQAGVLDKARSCYLAAARNARDRFAHDDAERLYRLYLALVDTPTPESVAARNELALKVMQIRGRASEAIAEQKLALEQARELGDREGQAQALFGLGNIFRQTGQLDATHELYGQALAIARELGDLRLEASTLGSLGILLYEQSRIEEASTSCKKALAIARELGDLQLEAHNLSTLAILCERQGHIEEARLLYNLALAMHRELGDRRREWATMGNLANLLRDQGLVDEARTLLEQALDITRELGDLRFEGMIVSNLAALHADRGHLNEARALFERALAIHREVGNRLVEATTLRLMAAMLRQYERDRPEAERIVQEAEAILREAGNTLEVAFCLCERAHLALAAGHSGRAWLQQAEEIAASLGLQPESELCTAIARSSRAQEAFEEARPLFRGELAVDLPAGLRQWLVETGQLVF